MTVSTSLSRNNQSSRGVKLLLDVCKVLTISLVAHWIGSEALKDPVCLKLHDEWSTTTTKSSSNSGSTSSVISSSLTSYQEVENSSSTTLTMGYHHHHDEESSATTNTNTNFACHLYLNYYVSFYQALVAPFAEHRMAEPILAVLGFTLAGSLFTTLSVLGVKKMKEDTTSTGVSLEDDDVKKSRKNQGEERRGKIVATALSDALFWMTMNLGIYLGVIEVSQRFFMIPLGLMHLVQSPAGVPSLPPSPLRLIVEVAFSVWFYDFLFFFIHWSFHVCGSNAAATKQKEAANSKKQTVGISSSSWSAWWYGLHLAHHDHYQNSTKSLHVLNTFHHHLADASAQVGINIIVQQLSVVMAVLAMMSSLSSASSSSLLLGYSVSERHIMSKLVHNVVVTYLLVEAHSGYDLFFMSHRLLPAFLGGAVRHQVHHDVGRKYYHQFFKYLDDYLLPRLSGSDEKKMESLKGDLNEG